MRKHWIGIIKWNDGTILKTEPFYDYDEGIKVWSSKFSYENKGKFEWIDYKKIEPKQETLEQAAEKYSENWEEITGLDYENVVPSEVNKLDFINGAKWQQEQNKKLYSEEEVHDIIESYQNNVENNPVHITYDKWFEQFKKKCL
jgi:hypothetical protein